LWRRVDRRWRPIVRIVRNDERPTSDRARRGN
jgi:hypothetical protein